MHLRETFTARGHPNIMPTHRTTIMITRDEELTPRGDCIVAVKAEKGLVDLNPRLKEAMKRTDSKIRLVITAGDQAFEVAGNGATGLILSHPADIVARKSQYICDRTLMIRADKAACDMCEAMISLLKDADVLVNVTISVEL
jgi:hypothetical protein